MFTFLLTNVITVLVNVISILVLQSLLPIAFYTLLERRVMAAVQRRKGPNAVGIWGSLQPLADGLKVMVKEGVTPRFASGILYFVAPNLSLIVALTCWALLPVGNNASPFDNDIGLIILLACSGVGIYGLILAGWASYSKYAFMGALRSIAQAVSYEVVLLLTIFPLILFTGSFSLVHLVEVQARGGWFVFSCLPLAMIFFVIMLAETNRTPFDLPEAEAELVSGFNVEYSSIMFAMFFLAEYGSMLIMSTLFSILFLGGWANGTFLFVIKIVAVAYSFVFVRALLPRYRYDQLMFLCWRVFLPLVLGFYIYTLGLVSITGATSVKADSLWHTYMLNTRPLVSLYFTAK